MRCARTLAQLEAEGSITRHVGRGTFLAGRTRPADAATQDSVAHTSPAELMEARLRIEPALAELIATNATPADFERMEMCLERAERAPTLDEFELWDAALHGALAQATHNRFVVRVIDMVTAGRQQAEWGKLKNRIVTPERRLRYQEEHREIVQALRERDAERARAAIIAHLQHARRNLFGYWELGDRTGDGRKGNCRRRGAQLHITPQSRQSSRIPEKYDDGMATSSTA
jgi:DNA-binding FadR family transcriptional regulator